MSPRRAPRGRVQNPFERSLVEALHAPLCSPGMFRIREAAAGFRWDIEQVAALKPAHIEPCSSQFAPTPDPVLEKKATAAIDRFFSQEVIVPSPLSEVTKRAILPTDSMEKTSYCDGYTQTELTFPAILPPDIENALKPFYVNTSKEANDADAIANASLRRKLCFEEFSDEEESISIMEHMQYSSGTPLRGLKRTLDASFETSITGNANIVSKSLNMSSFVSTSPVLNVDSNIRHSNEIGRTLKSPSLSPIRRVSDLQKDCNESSDTKSLDNNSHHDCNSSIFSQSTPEKLGTKLSDESSANVFDTSETYLVKAKFNDDISRFGKNNLKLNKCSQSEFAICTTGKNTSQSSSDYNMDVSCESYSRNQSYNSLIDDNTSSTPLQSQVPGNTIIDFNTINRRSVLINPGMENDINKRNQIQFNDNDYASDKSAMNCETYDQFSEFYQHLTPKKNNKEYLFDVVRSPKRKSSYTNISSPARMSLDNSFNIDTDKLFVKECPQPIHDNNMGFDSTLYTGNFSYNNSEAVKSSIQRMDSGFLEHLSNSNSTICNSTKYNSTLDVTKSFQSSGESSNVRWRRFDSGFHDETSSEFNQHTNSNDSLKCNKKCSPVSEALEDHEDLVNFNKYFNIGSHESMSMSDMFTDDMVSLRNNNFSSTPSKNQTKK